MDKESTGSVILKQAINDVFISKELDIVKDEDIELPKIKKEEEKQWLTRINQKSELAKSYVPQRGKRKMWMLTWSIQLIHGPIRPFWERE